MGEGKKSHSGSGGGKEQAILATGEGGKKIGAVTSLGESGGGRERRIFFNYAAFWREKSVRLAMSAFLSIPARGGGESVAEKMSTHYQSHFSASMRHRDIAIISRFRPGKEYELNGDLETYFMFMAVSAS